MNRPGPDARRYIFESLRFDAATHELCRAGRTVKLRPQVALALALLLSRRGGVVTKEELRQALWPDGRVVLFEGSIAAVIRELRRALGDNPKTPRFIETIPKRGYRFLSPPADSPERRPRASRKHAGPPSGGVIRVLSGLVIASLMVLPGGDERAGAWRSPAPGPEPITVAVFPFEDLSRRPAHRVLAQTVSHDLVGWLGPAAPQRLRVVDGTDDPLKHRPVADFVLHGSIRDDAEAVIVSARLLTEADNGFVWGEDYRRKAEDTSLTSREVAARIAEQVLYAAMPRATSAAPWLSDAAATAYRRGMAGLALQSTEGTAEAVAAFEQAVRLAPDFADAHGRLAQALIRWPGPLATPERVARSRRVAERALRLDADNAVAHRVLGEIHLYFDRDWSLAGRRLQRSVELAPADPSVHHAFATWLAARGRPGEALRAIDLAEALDPASVLISIDAMLIRFYARDFEATVEASRRLQQLWPESGASHRYIVLSRLAIDDFAGAAAEARRALAGLDADSEASTFSDPEALDAYWAATFRGISRYVRKQSGDPTVLALVLVQMGRLDEAVRMLEQAVSTPRFSYFLPYLGVSPAFDRLCGNPRFERILRRLGQSAVSRDLSRCESATRVSTRPLEKG